MGKPNGIGKFINEKYKEQYEGEFVNGVREGKGVYQKQKSKYVGQFSKNEIHGKGVLSIEGWMTFEGEFERGKKQGLGTFTKHRGKTESKFQCQYSEGLPIGEGTLILKSGKEIKVQIEDASA